MKIGFFGGSFNPPTNAHMSIAKESVKKLNLDKFFFVPVGNLYSKQGLIDEQHRYNMLKIACENQKNIYVEDIELNKSNKLSAFDAFEMIKNKYNKMDNNEIFFVMGADNFIKISTWKRNKELIEKYKYIIFERSKLDLTKYIQENELLSKNKDNFYLLKLEQNEKISSGMIRELLKSEEYEKCKKLTSPKIIKYIKENKLY